MVALDPIALAGVGTGTIDWTLYPGTHQVKLANYSSFALKIRVQGRDRWLDLQTADLYEVSGLSLIYNVVAAVTPAAPGSLLVTLADQPGERIPGIYPLHLR